MRKKLLSLFCLGLLGFGAAFADSNTFNLEGTNYRLSNRTETTSDWTVTANYDEGTNKLTLSNFISNGDDTFFCFNGNSVTFEFIVDPTTGKITASPVQMMVWFYGYGSAAPYDITGSIYNEGDGNSTLYLNPIASGFFNGAEIPSNVYTAEPATLPFHINLTTSGTKPGTDPDPDTPLPTINIEYIAISGVTATTASVDYKLSVSNLAEGTNYAYKVVAKDAQNNELGSTTGDWDSFDTTSTHSFGLELLPGTNYTVSVTAYLLSQNDTVATSPIKDNLEINTPEETDVTLTVGNPSVTYVQKGERFTATLIGELSSEDEIEDYSQYKVSYEITAPADNNATGYATITKDGTYKLELDELNPETQYTIKIIPLLSTLIACGTPITPSFTTPKLEEMDGIETIEVTEADGRYFSFDGVEIVNPLPGTLCIKVVGNTVSKVIVR